NGMNFIAGSHEQAVNIELTATRYRVTYCDGLLAHANHYEAAEFLSLEDDFPIKSPDTLLRSGRMRQLLQENQGTINVKVLQRLLKDHAGGPGAICRHDAYGYTTKSSVIHDLHSGKIWVTRGNPCSEPFREFALH